MKNLVFSPILLTVRKYFGVLSNILFKYGTFSLNIPLVFC